MLVAVFVICFFVLFGFVRCCCGIFCGFLFWSVLLSWVCVCGAWCALWCSVVLCGVLWYSVVLNHYGGEWGALQIIVMVVAVITDFSPGAAKKKK